jgi:hypothetical protein
MMKATLMLGLGQVGLAGFCPGARRKMRPYRESSWPCPTGRRSRVSAIASSLRCWLAAPFAGGSWALYMYREACLAGESP